MSLDVSAYTRIELLQLGEYDQAFEDAHETEIGEGIVFLWPNADFPDHAEGVATGYYRVERPATDVNMNLRYSYYDEWRTHLSALTTGDPNYGRLKNLFPTLLCFGDNEGIIGPSRCRGLAQELAEWEERAVDYAEKLDQRRLGSFGKSWIEVYRGWRRIAEAVSPEGVIQFH